MDTPSAGGRVSIGRRDFLLLAARGLGTAGLGGLLAACGQAPAAPTPSGGTAGAAGVAAATAGPTLQIAWPSATATSAAAPTAGPIPAPIATRMPPVAAPTTALAAAAPTTAARSAPPAVAPTSGLVSSQTGERPVTPTFYSWITNLHPSIPAINDEFSKTTPLNMQIAPTQGFGIDRFVAEAKDKNSTWDVYVGMTPFVEMVSLVKADVIEPWDNYMPKEVLDDILPAFREECSYKGKLYSWPFFLDIIGQGWNTTITDKAGITDKEGPKDWDAFNAFGKQVQDKKAANYGATFDAHGWRSIAPITHSMATDVYYNDEAGEPLFDFTNDAVVAALQQMKIMKEQSGPNVLNPGTIDGGVNDTPDENMFAAQEVAYYVKYFNAPLRMAATWSDPSKLALAPLPKFKNGKGSTVFWTTGCCLFKYGQNKQGVVDYLKKLTYDERIWKDSIQGTPAAHPGQLPPYKSLYDKWNASKPDWMQPFVPLVRAQLDVAKAIPNHKYGLSQFNIGQPSWEKFLKGEESDPKKALQAAKDAVAAENRRNP